MKRDPDPDPPVGMGDLQRFTIFTGHFHKEMAVNGHSAADELHCLTCLQAVSDTYGNRAVRQCPFHDADDVVTSRITGMVFQINILRRAEEKTGSVAAMADLAEFFQPFRPAAVIGPDRPGNGRALPGKP